MIGIRLVKVSPAPLMLISARMPEVARLAALGGAAERTPVDGKILEPTVLIPWVAPSLRRL